MLKNNKNEQINYKGLKSPFALILLGFYYVYKILLSPLIGRQCRYLPTCSDYAKDCVIKHGAWFGAFMGFARVCRCHPKGGSGFDPAPDVIDRSKWLTPWECAVWKFDDKLDTNRFNNISEV